MLQCIVQIGCPAQTYGMECSLFVVMNYLHIFYGVVISPSIFTQEDITRLLKVLPHMFCYKKNATRFYICSLFPWLQAVISQNLFLDVISKYSKHLPLAILVFMKYIKIHANGFELGRTTTNDSSGFVVHHINEASPNPPHSSGKQLHLPVWDEMSSSSSSSASSNILDKNPSVKNDSSKAQENPSRL